MLSEENSLGGLIAHVRRQRGWTLREMSKVVGIPLSTLAKVEACKLSMSYDKLQQLVSRLGMTLPEFLGQTTIPSEPGGLPIVVGRRSLTGDATTIDIPTPNYDYHYLCADLSNKRMVPILVRIRSGDMTSFGEPVTHQGEEFVFVLEGQIEVHLQYYTPVILGPGQGVYVDSSMKHAYIAKDCDSALVLAVCSAANLELADELISLARKESTAA